MQNAGSERQSAMAEAVAAEDEARVAYFAAKRPAARREADEAYQFWISRVAALERLPFGSFPDERT